MAGAEDRGESKLRLKAGKRRAKFEDRMGGREECRIMTECYRKKKKNADEGEREVLQEEWVCHEEVERLKAEGRWMCAELSERAEIRTSKREGRESGNRVTIEDVPVYLRRKSAKERKMMTRFRCGNEERENRYWTEGEEITCRMCREERETKEHMWNGCDKTREREGKEWREILSEDGREIRWMKEVWKRSERIEKERGGNRN
jgi:hypothetical protein